VGDLRGRHNSTFYNDKFSLHLPPFKKASGMWLCNVKLILCIVRSVVIRKHLEFVSLGKISKSGDFLWLMRVV
jgi:hypothetical protein